MSLRVPDRYSITRLLKPRFNDAADFVCTEFVRGSVLHQALAIPEDDYAAHMKQSFMHLMGQAFSFVAVDNENGRIAGCILAGDFKAPAGDAIETLDAMQPIKSLLDELERGYRLGTQMTTGDALLVDVAVVSPPARGEGLYSRLRQQIHTSGREHGFKYVLGELSSAFTQQYCVGKLGHRIVSEIAYKDFKYQGRYPFADIEHPASIQMTEGALSPACL
ncbi:MAG: hypothetical protein KTR33_02885 [Gammaproteobacteria bacterium]|nr:hypothetical protein [Gammaproteobacteria bacterium]